MCVPTGRRTHVDDRPAAGPNQRRDTVLAAEEDAAKIDGEHLVPMIGWRVDER